MSKDPFQHITDAELLEKFYSEHDTKWLGIVLQRYTFLLLGVCMKYLKNEEAAKDAVQQIFLKAILELGKYKVDYLKSWLYMVAKNHCLMQLRNKHTTVPVDEQPMLMEEKDDFYDQTNKEIALDLLELALNELTLEQKTCVKLFYLEKQSYHEITGITGYSLLQVKSFIQNGKRNLKILVEKKMHAKE